MMDPVRTEALRLAVQIACVGNYPNVGERAEFATRVADMFDIYLRLKSPAASVVDREVANQGGSLTPADTKASSAQPGRE